MVFELNSKHIAALFSVSMIPALENIFLEYFEKKNRSKISYELSRLTSHENDSNFFENYYQLLGKWRKDPDEFRFKAIIQYFCTHYTLTNFITEWAFYSYPLLIASSLLHPGFTIKLTGAYIAVRVFSCLYAVKKISTNDISFITSLNRNLEKYSATIYILLSSFISFWGLLSLPATLQGMKEKEEKELELSRKESSKLQLFNRLANIGALALCRV